MFHLRHSVFSEDTIRILTGPFGGGECIYYNNIIAENVNSFTFSDYIYKYKLYTMPFRVKYICICYVYCYKIDAVQRLY